MATVDIIIGEHLKALVLLTSMPDTWDVTVNSICSLAGKNKLVYNEVQDTLLSEETRRKKNDDEESSATTSALLVRGRW